MSKSKIKIIPEEPAVDAHLKIADLRQNLREIDEQMIDFLAERLALVEEIGLAKKSLGLPIADNTREDENLLHNTQYAKGRIPANWVAEFTNLISKWSKDVQGRP